MLKTKTKKLHYGAIFHPLDRQKFKSLLMHFYEKVVGYRYFNTLLSAPYERKLGNVYQNTNAHSLSSQFHMQKLITQVYAQMFKVTYIQWYSLSYGQ